VGTVVEFCGLPGAGKSTIARGLVASLRLQGVPTTEVMAPIGPTAPRATRVRRKTAVVARAIVGPGGVAVATNLGVRSGQADRRDRVARPVNLLVVRDAVRRARGRAGVHVLDQGPLQEWWSAALRGDAARVLRWAAADPAPRADLVVRVDTPTDVLVERLGRRVERQSRLEASDGPALAAELARGGRLLDALCEQLVHSPGTHRPLLIRVDGLDPGAVADVWETLRRLG
jgi:adenylate kinase family enzyme